MESTQPAETPSRSDSIGMVVLGVLLTPLLHGAAWFLVTSWDGFETLIAILFIGAVQLVYMVPAFAIAWLTGWHGAAKGLAIGAALTALLNIGCWGFVR